jgi:hypothetical protein
LSSKLNYSIILEIALLCCAGPIVVCFNSSYLAASLASQKPKKKQLKIMGFNYKVYLFNQRTYTEKVLPAFHTFLAKNDPDPVIALLKECIRYLNDNPELSEKLLWDEELCEEAIGILTGTVYYSPDNGRSTNQGNSDEAYKIRKEYARNNLSSMVIEILCVPQYSGVSSEQNMSNYSLIPYLYEKSQYIEDLFTSVKQVRGGPLELPIGESSELFTKQDIQEFNMHLDKVPVPKDSAIRKEYDNLRALLKLALGEDDLTLVLALI